MQAKTNSETGTGAARTSSRFYKLFYGPSELRVGWRLLIFVMIVVV